jgi:2-iminobutanoate/2-iminopropanoate deaminase
MKGGTDMKKILFIAFCVLAVILIAGQVVQSADRAVISTDKAPKAIGPYSQAIRYGDMLFVSGMIAIDPKTNELSKGDIEAQATLVLDNIKAVVETAGFSMKNVLKAEVFMKDLKDFGKYNAIYVKYFPENPPARVTVQAAALPRDVLIEISVICGK